MVRHKFDRFEFARVTSQRGTRISSPASRASGRRCRQRYGSAPIELLLALPILLVMLSLIFCVCSVTQTRMAVTTSARNVAFAKRHTPWKFEPETLSLEKVEAVGKVLGSSRKMSPGSGLVSGEANGAPTGIFGPLRSLVMSTESKRFVLGGGWDFQEIEFKKHRPLTLTDKAETIGFPADQLTAFTSLGRFGAGAGGSFGNVQTQALQRIQAAQTQITRRLAAIRQEIASAQATVNQLNRQIANLRSSGGNVAELEQKRDALREHIDELKDERSRLSTANSHLGVNLKLPTAGAAAGEELPDNPFSFNNAAAMLSMWNSLKPDEKKAIIGLVQIGLDLAGIVSPSPAFDLASFAIAFSQGDKLGMVVSAISMIPYVGDLAKLANIPKYGATIAAAQRVIRNSANAQRFLIFMGKYALSDGVGFPQ